MEHFWNIQIILKYVFVYTKKFFLCDPRLINCSHFLLLWSYIFKKNMQIHKNADFNYYYLYAIRYTQLMSIEFTQFIQLMHN